jgi:hypothetical protein
MKGPDFFCEGVLEHLISAAHYETDGRDLKWWTVFFPSNLGRSWQDGWWGMACRPVVVAPRRQFARISLSALRGGVYDVLPPTGAERRCKLTRVGLRWQGWPKDDTWWWSDWAWLHWRWDLALGISSTTNRQNGSGGSFLPMSLGQKRLGWLQLARQRAWSSSRVWVQFLEDPKPEVAI